MQEAAPLPRTFYQRESPIVARDLLGKIIVRSLPSTNRQERGRILEGRIVETEAYGGSDDPASHAFRGRTKRNEAMFGEAGHAYVYFTYGMHYCLNFVTSNRRGAGAVLIRAVEPLLYGESVRSEDNFKLANGPAKVCRLFLIDKAQDKLDVTNPLSELWVKNAERKWDKQSVITSERIGIRRGISKRWRFYFDACPYVSRG